MARQNLIFSLDGKPAYEMLQTEIIKLANKDRKMMQKSGIFVGRAIDPNYDKFGHGDFLIRGVIGVDPNQGAIAIGDFFQNGDKIQLHVRDAESAEEDLAMMLAPQTFYSPAQGALLFSCNGRGTRLFDHPNGDISIVQDAVNGVPIAGFFCAGEFGPISGRNFVHGHTACLVIFRSTNGTYV
jgi:small ligand-binding sensory domain FIST